jgi:hypothetical protein
VVTDTVQKSAGVGRRVWMVVGIVVLVIVAAGGGFLWGRSVGESQASQARQQFARGRFVGQGDWTPGLGQTPQPGRQNARPGGGGTMGTIESIEGDTLVVSTQEGSIRVKTTDTTLIQKFTSVGVDALETGEQVMVAGTKGDDGTITARSIQSLRAFQMPQTDEP